MINLTKVAYYTRRALIFGSLIFVIFLALRFAVGYFINYYRAQNPPPKAKPTVAFGKLPALSLDTSGTLPTSFKLQLIEGRPPEGTESAKVFFIPKKPVKFFSRERAIQFAANLSFTGAPDQIDTVTFRFNDDLTGNSLIVDITNSNFIFQANYLRPAVFAGTTPPGKEIAISQAQKYFTALGFSESLFKNALVTYLKFSGQDLIETSSLSTAQAVRVDFLKDLLEGLPVIPAGYNRSGVHIIFSGSAEKTAQVLKAAYLDFPPELTTSATYPTISGQQAWEMLQQGKGFVLRPLLNGSEAIIRKIYLAYLEKETYQPYLQPVYVFEGDQNFVGIVPAIDPLWIGAVSP